MPPDDQSPGQSSMPPPEQKSSVSFQGHVDLSSVDAMFATILAKHDAFKEMMNHRLDVQDKMLGDLTYDSNKRLTVLEQWKTAFTNRGVGVYAVLVAVVGVLGFCIQAAIAWFTGKH